MRNPIAALIGYAELIDGDLDPEQRLFLQRVRDTAAKLHAVAADLVDLAWIEAGMPLKQTRLELRQIIQSVIEALTPVAQAKQITFFISVQEPLSPIMGDPDRIHAVIYALLHNAILYSGEQQMVAVHAWGDHQQVFCSVADRGIGIAPDELELVFDRLYRARDPRVRALPGSGLGLTLARRIINRHGGEIWATSEPDKGSTFAFRLPACDA